MDQVCFLSAACGWACCAIVNMHMRRSICDGILGAEMSFQALMKIAGLRNINRTPIPIGQQFRVNVDSGGRFQSGPERMDFVAILFARLARPGTKSG